MVQNLCMHAICHIFTTYVGVYWLTNTNLQKQFACVDCCVCTTLSIHTCMHTYKDTPAKAVRVFWLPCLCAPSWLWQPVPQVHDQSHGSTICVCMYVCKYVLFVCYGSQLGRWHESTIRVCIYVNMRFLFVMSVIYDPQWYVCVCVPKYIYI